MEPDVLVRALDGGLAMLVLVVLYALIRSGTALIALFRTQGQERHEDTELARQLTTLIGEQAANNINVIAANTTATLRVSEAVEKLAESMNTNTGAVYANRALLVETVAKLDQYQVNIDDSIGGLAGSMQELGTQLKTFDSKVEAVVVALQGLHEMQLRAESIYATMARAMDADYLLRIKAVVKQQNEERANDVAEEFSSNNGDSVADAGAASAGAGRGTDPNARGASSAGASAGGRDHAAGVAAGAGGAAGDGGPGRAAAGHQPGAERPEGKLPGGNR
jgi:hypothetical protein